MLSLFIGLKAQPQFLKDTMMPDISPETVANSAVQLDGGHDPCRFSVSTKQNGKYSVFESFEDNAAQE